MPRAVRCKGSKLFRWRIVASILSGRPIRIDGIRHKDEKPGLRGLHAWTLPVRTLTPGSDYEAAFLRLVDKVTNGTEIDINETGMHAVHARYTPAHVLRN